MNRPIQFLLVSIFTLISFGCWAQAKPAAPEIFTFVEKMPSFPGDVIDYMEKNIRYPTAARDSGIEGRVILNLFVDEEGSIFNIRVIRGIGGGCDSEAVRLVRGMPKWIPASQNGIKRKVSLWLPVLFKLEARSDTAKSRGK